MTHIPKAVVTGGAGFIGSHIAEELVQRGYHTAVIDDLSTGKMENIQHLFNSHFEFIRGSITDFSLLQKIFFETDLVFHEAAIAGVPQSIENPAASHDANLTGSLNVLMAARNNKVKKVVCASSCAIYGNDPTLPKRENMSPDPQSPYAVTKLAMEYYCQVFFRVYRLPTVCLRYFNVYGPRQSPHSDYAAVIPKFIQRVRDGKPPVIYGDGEQSRDFIFVKDVVTANLLAAESEAVGVYNLGTGEQFNLNQLAQLIIALSGRIELKPIYDKARPGEVKHSRADVSQAANFGFKPGYQLEAGLKELFPE